MLVLSLIVFLFSNAITLRRDKAIFYSRSFFFTVVSCFFLLNDFSTEFYYLDAGFGLYSGMLHVNYLTDIFQSFFLILLAALVQLTAYYPRKIWHNKFSNIMTMVLEKRIYNNTEILNKTAKQFRIIEFPLIVLFITIGSFFIINSQDIISIFLGLELQSYGLYIISTIYKNSELSTSGGLTYFLLGSLSSCFILLGSSLLYLNYGCTNLEGIYIVSNISNSWYNDMHVNTIYYYKNYFLHISLIIFSMGLIFKLSGAPFHFWSPDVYDAIPTLITSFVAILAKISIFILLLELVHYTNKNVNFDYNWKICLTISALLSLIFGSIGGLTQLRIKRLYAYSTISHIGYILLALSINSIESIQAYIFYVIQYSISNLNAFIILLSIGYSLFFLVENKKQTQDFKYIQENNNSPVQQINQLKGYFYINPTLAISLIITLFSFIGIPPLLGFFGKQMILSAALDKGYYFLTIIAVLTSVISAVYYLVIIKQILFFKPLYDNFTIKNIKVSAFLKNTAQTEYLDISIVLSSSLTILISGFSLILFIFLFTPQECLDITLILSILLFNT